MIKNTILLIFSTILLSTNGLGQSEGPPANHNNSAAVNANSSKLLKAIRENKSDEEIARNYYDLAEALVTTGDYPKALMYMNKAIEWESKTKTKKNLAEYYRGLARIQELQNMNEDASVNYSKAAQLSGDSLQKQLNKNDAIRLQHNF